MEGLWALDDSPSGESSSGDSSSTSSSSPVPVRGRGRGQRPRGRPRRVPAAPEPVVPSPTADVVAVAAELPLSSFIRPLGGPSCELVARLLRRPAVEEPPAEVSHYLGDVAPPVNVTRNAEKLNMPPRTFKRRMQTLAAAAFFGTRALAASLISTLQRKALQPTFRVVGIFRPVAYDETSMKTRVHRKENKEDPQLPVTTKLLQAECQFMVLYQNLPLESEEDKGAFDCIVLNLPCRVQVADRGTGEVLQAAVDKVSEIPGLASFRDENAAAFSTDVSHCDRAKSNNRAEDGLFARHGVPRVRMICVAHIASTAQGRGFSVVADDLTGIISMSLSQLSASGEAFAFQCHIRDVLFESIVGLHNRHPLPDTQPHSLELR